MRLNLPIRSTIHAVCCGTKRIIVFAGREGRAKKEGGLLLPPPPYAKSEAGGCVLRVGADVFGVREYDRLLDCVVRAEYEVDNGESRCRFEARSTPAIEASTTSLVKGAIGVEDVTASRAKSWGMMVLSVYSLPDAASREMLDIRRSVSKQLADKLW
jgi:hypothetical protein